MTTQDAAAPEAVPLGAEGFKPMPHAEDQELAELEAQAQSEQATKPDATSEAQEQSQEQVGEQAEATEAEQPPAEDAKPAKKPIFIPKERLDQEARRAREAEAAAAYWKGQADALKTTGTAQPQRQTATPEQQISRIEADLVAKAEQFDNGQMTLRAFKEFEIKANAALSQLRALPQGAPVPTSDMRLQELTEQLLVDFPILAELKAEDVEPLEPRARRELQAEGAVLRNDPQSAYQIRRRVAELAQRIHGGPVAQARPGASQASEAIKSKVALAQKMPPDINRLGGSTQVADLESPQRILTLDPDEIAALPEATLRRLTGQ